MQSSCMLGIGSLWLELVYCNITLLEFWSLIAKLNSYIADWLHTLNTINLMMLCFYVVGFFLWSVYILLATAICLGAMLLAVTACITQTSCVFSCLSLLCGHLHKLTACLEWVKEPVSWIVSKSMSQEYLHMALVDSSLIRKLKHNI